MSSLHRAGSGPEGSDGRVRRRTRPYWLLAVIAVVLLSPPTAVAIAAVGAALALEVAVRSVRRAVRGREQAAGNDSADAVLLGSDAAGGQVLLSDRQLSAHALILGASGAGKSTTMLRLLTAHIERGRPVLAIDLKGSPAFAAVLAESAAAAGRPFRLWTPDGPSHWNPLQHGNATELKDKLIATERFTEPHYQRAAERYVQTVLQVLISARDGLPPTLQEVVGLMEPRRLSRILRDTPAPLAERVQDYLGSLSPDQVSAIRGLGTRLALISESHTGTFLEPVGDPNRSVDVRAALAGGDVVLFSLNSSTYGKLAAQVGTLAVQDLITAVGHRLTHPSGAPALIGIDEFSALGADNVIALLARGREAGVSVLLATQELADLDRAARGLRDQVLGNTAVKIAHRQDVPASAQTVAQMAGTESSWEYTFQTSAGSLLPRHDTGRGTRRQVERFVIHPNEIKALPTGHAVVLTKLPVASARMVRVAQARRPGAAGPGARPGVAGAAERPGVERE
jgi:conjugal transfer pilus assembly protein TraD